MLCFRLLNEDEPAAPLTAAVDALRQGQSAGNVFDVEPVSFRQVPNAPFAYWVSDTIRGLFRDNPAFEGGGRAARQGLATADDFRFVRAAWETPVSAERTNGWCHFVKGGSYSPFYSDVFLKVDWHHRGKGLDAFSGSVIRNPEFYFRPGITWPRRTQSGLALRAMPAGCAFADKGPAAFVAEDNRQDLAHLLALTTSEAFRGLVELQMAFGSYEVGVIQRTVLPDKYDPQLTTLAHAGWALKRRADTSNLSSHAFFSPALVRERGSLTDRLAVWAENLNLGTARLAAIREEIDAIASRLYGIGEEDQRAIKQMLAKGQTTEAVADESEDADADDADDTSNNPDAPGLVAELLDYAIGCALGRWDIRYATGAKAPPPEPDPFDPLPVCPPGMLQNAAGQPAAPAEVPADYPLTITWSGILVDDPHQPNDIEHRVREVFAVIYAEQADARVDEAVTLLGASSLRDYLLKPAGFFAGHLKRYSKSRRQAPIYWPLSSPKGLTTVWLYYHRITPDTFFTVLREHIKPRLEDEERRLFNLKQQAGPSATPSQVREIGAVEDLVEDLRAFRDELQRIAPLWRPDLNDGVIINHAPLWRMTAHAPWRKALKDCWDALVAEKYDWAHLALHLWPERVIPKCAKDHSLAIAHGLEEFFWAPDPKTGEMVSRKRDEKEIAVLVTERTSPAVKAALESLLTAPAPTGGTAKRGRKKSA